jgi:DNA invertase Pin-like site-specific DNA recombinase
MAKRRYSVGAVYGYLRVSTDEQARSGLGVEAQRASIVAEADRRQWTVEYVTDDGYSAKNLHRPGLSSVLGRLGPDDVLVVAKLDRLSRSTADFAGLLARSHAEGWSLVVLDLALDTTTPMGEFVALTMANIAQLERRMIGQRTSEALQAAKARGQRLGIGNRVLDPSIQARIVCEHDSGSTLTRIAQCLNEERVPTARGGARWYPSTVRAAIRSDRLDREAQARAGI